MNWDEREQRSIGRTEGGWMDIEGRERGGEEAGREARKGGWRGWLAGRKGRESYTCGH